MDKNQTQAPIHVESFQDVKHHLGDFDSRLTQVEHNQDDHHGRLLNVESVLDSQVLIVKDIEALQDAFSQSQRKVGEMESRLLGHLGTISRVVIGNARSQKLTQYFIGILCGIVLVLNFSGLVLLWLK